MKTWAGGSRKATFPHKDLSIFAAAYRHSVPATVHVGIGYDIIHEHPELRRPGAGRRQLP